MLSFGLNLSITTIILIIKKIVLFKRYVSQEFPFYPFNVVDVHTIAGGSNTRSIFKIT